MHDICPTGKLAVGLTPVEVPESIKVGGVQLLITVIDRVAEAEAGGLELSLTDTENAKVPAVVGVPDMVSEPPLCA